MNPRKTFSLLPINTRAFSLVEVVVALGICTFVLFAMVGLLGTGLQSGKDSEDQIQAANMASLLISTRVAAPTNSIANFAIPESAMTNGYSSAYAAGTNYLGYDGKTTNAASASYRIVYQAGTNAMTGSAVSQVYLMLSWPAQANPANAAVRSYELLTYIPL